MLKKRIALVCLFVSSFVYSQTAPVAYTRDFEFTEGLYLTFQHFKNNLPIAKSAIISDNSKTDTDFLKNETEKKQISYLGLSGNETKIETSSIWGYYQNRSLYIHYNNKFNRVNNIGTLIHFTAVVISTITFMDPMYSNYGIKTTTDELRQYIYDTETHKVVPLDVKNLSELLKRDAELSAEYEALKKREKMDSQFIYLRKYNEKHPLLIGNGE